MNTLFSWGAEVLADMKVSGPLRFQSGAGRGSGVLHGKIGAFDTDYGISRLSFRMLFQQPSKIGGAFEVLLWFPDGDGLDDFSAVRIGVVF
ncbi:MAG: hypothetical protein AB1772_09620 [Candidatus Zixiibacteriota bacterium]